MIHRILFSLTLATLLCQLGSADELAKDQEKMQGDWQVISLRLRGEDINVEPLSKGGYIFTAAKLKITGERESVAEVTLRPDSKPKEIDLKSIEGIGKGKQVFGLYRFDEEQLVLCLGDVRPKDFSGDGEAGLIVLKLRSKKD